MNTINLLIVLLVTIIIYNDLNIIDYNKTSEYETESINSLHLQNMIEDQSMCSYKLFERSEDIDKESVTQSVLVLNFFYDGGQFGCLGPCVNQGTHIVFCCFVVVAPHPEIR